MDLLQLADGDVRVDLRGLQVGVAEHGLNEADVGAAFEHESRHNLAEEAAGLEITTDELLQPGGPKRARKPSRKVLRRLEQIESLPSPQQTVLLKTIDSFLKNAVLKSARRG